MFRQGDVLVVPIQGVDVSKLAKIPREGGSVVLAHGEATGHRHRFAGRKTALYSPWPNDVKEPSARIEHARKLLASLPDIAADAMVVGVLNLEKADTLLHEEHDPIEHEAGTYLVIRQRTYTPEAIVVVAD